MTKREYRDAESSFIDKWDSNKFMGFLYFLFSISSMIHWLPFTWTCNRVHGFLKRKSQSITFMISGTSNDFWIPIEALHLLHFQWRVQDFSEEGGFNCKGGDANLLLWPISPQNCMELKKKWTQGGVPGAALPWIRPTITRRNYVTT